MLELLLNKCTLSTMCDCTVLVDVVLDGQQVVAHGLEGELMEDWGDRVETSVQDDQL